MTAVRRMNKTNLLISCAGKIKGKINFAIKFTLCINFPLKHNVFFIFPLFLLYITAST